MPPRNLIVNPDGRFALAHGAWTAASLTRGHDPAPAPEAWIVSAFQGSGIDLLHRPDVWIDIDPRETYRLAVWVRRIDNGGVNGSLLLGVDEADALGSINQTMVHAPDPGASTTGTLALLVSPVSPGQTTVTLDRDALAAGFPSGASGNEHIALNASLVYADLPNRQAVKYTSVTGAVLTLAAPVPAGITAAAGTDVRWHQDGATFSYAAATGIPSASVPTTWTLYEALLHGTRLPWQSGFAQGGTWGFRSGTTRIRPIAITGSGATSTVIMQYVFGLQRLATMLPAAFIPGPRELRLVQHRTLHQPILGTGVAIALNGGRNDHWELAATTAELTPEEHADLRAWSAEVGLFGEVMVGDPTYRGPTTPGLTGMVQTIMTSSESILQFSVSAKPALPAESTTIPVAGLPTSVTGLLRRGDYVQVGDGFHQLTARVDTDAFGIAQVEITPPTRVAIPSGTPVRFENPRMRARLVQIAGTELPIGQTGPISLAFEEIV